jgi:predicted ribosomally synthesized peptide with SipW-like signal peptide
MLAAARFRPEIARKLLLSFGVLLLAVAIVGVGAFASFTSSTTATQAVSAGSVTIALGVSGASTNRLSVAAAGLVPGDTVQRSVDLVNSGSANLASVSLTTTASPTSLLDTDATNGLQMTIARCSVPWTEAGSSPAFTYTCSGTTSVVLASRAVIGADLAQAHINATTAGATSHLRVTLTLPTTATNAFQSLTSTISYTFTGLQRVGTDQ